MRTLVKREVKKYNVRDFYNNYTEIIRNIVLDITEGTEKKNARFGRFFEKNGMLITDVDIVDIGIERKFATILEQHQTEQIKKEVELADADARMKVITALAATEKAEADLNNETELYRMTLKQARVTEQMKFDEETREKQRVAEAARVQAQNDLQKLLSEIQTAEMARQKEKDDAEIAHKKELADIEKARQTAYAETVVKIMNSVQPGLIEALNAKANADILTTGMQEMSPYAIANNESVADTVNKLMRGTTLEGFMANMAKAPKA
jgi:hypothetical protein